MRSKWAASKARGGRISKSIRNRRATQLPTHFHRNPLGHGQLAVFPRCSLLTYRFRYARYSRLEKQPTDLRRKACLFRERDTKDQLHSRISLSNGCRTSPVYRLLNPLGFVALKMGHRQGRPSPTDSRRAHPAPVLCCRGEKRTGEKWCGMLVVTASPPRAGLKISQLTRRPPGGMSPTYDSKH